MRSRLIRWVLPLVLVAFVGVGAAMAATTSKHAGGWTVQAVASSKYGTVLVAANGMTLYRYTLDKKGKSVCNGACAKYWPPLLLKGTAKETAGSGASAGLLGEAMRANGAAQVTYAGYPLYFYAGDKKPGDVNGEGFDKTWYVVNAKGALVKHAAAAGAPTPAPTTTTSSSGSAWG
jgi:predicted lipoprotein with Yx(FWY)xxD motif